jgi:hypothetical protein
MLMVLVLPGQQSWWADTDTLPAGTPRISPNSWRSVRVDTAMLSQIFYLAPNERAQNVIHSPIRISFPLPDGSSEIFSMVQYDMMEQGLAAAYPQFMTMKGVSLRNPSVSVHLDWTANGLSAALYYPDREPIFMDPLFRGNKSFYAVYRKSDYPATATAWTCDVLNRPKADFSPNETPKAGNCIFRAYRLAVSATAEYSNFHGAADSTEAELVLSAVVTAVNRLNQIFSRDIAVRLILVEGNDRLFFYNPNTDPFSNDAPSDMLGQNQTTIDSLIGSANYDIGHVFGTSGGGLALLGAPCTNNKAWGMTGLSNPVGDPFYIDYVAHEMGHQFGAGHTQNNDCNRSDPEAFEPGSASTIMGYAGICDPNIQSFSDPYFHAISLHGMATFIGGSTGNSCATPIFSPNDAPQIAPLPAFIVPKLTPFVLTAAASDPDNHPISYCWEQWDNEVAPMPPQPSQSKGPAFRSFLPSASPSRYFPRREDIHGNPTWEVLPAVSRVLNFRGTVRDFNGTFGCTAETQAAVAVNGDVGPFSITYPDTILDWQEGASHLVTWDVAGTNASPIFCAEVEILLSYDNGLTFPVLLAAGTANDGEQLITLPAGTANSARILVRCTGNIFFNTTRTHFRILPALTPDFVIYAVPESAQTCLSDVTFNLITSALQGYSDFVQLSVSGLPGGVVALFSGNPITPGSNAQLVLSGMSNVAPGTYPLTISATASTGLKTVTVFLVVIETPAVVSLLSPVNYAVDYTVRPTLAWNASQSARTYVVEVATDETFQGIVRNFATATTEVQISGLLEGSTTYFWRVRGVNLCTAGQWSEVRRFFTGPCLTFLSTEVPLEIDAEIDSIFSMLEIDAPGALISDLNVVKLRGAHTWVSDLLVSLIGPDNTSVRLFGPICGSDWDFDLNFDQDAAEGNIPCPPTTGLSYRPAEDLSVFYGRPVSGQWTLKVLDVWQQDGGVLDSWGLNVCMTGYQNPLPVSLLDFSVLAADHFIQLKWITESEQDNAGFEIERSEGFSGYFSTIGWVDGKGTSNEESHYNYVDVQVRQGITYYYRLRQTDFDGHYRYSPIQSAMLSGLPDARLYPNPAGSEFFVELPQQFLEDTVLEFMDIQGRTIFRRNAGTPLERFSTIGQPSGTYLVRVSSPGCSKIWRLILH